MVLDDVENLNYDSLEAVAHLRASERYKEIMQVAASSCVRAWLKHKLAQHKLLGMQASSCLKLLYQTIN